jgi:hypothetical protein
MGEDGLLPQGAYDDYIGQISQMLQESSGTQQKQLEAQLQDAEKARANQMAIARLQAETSRYGVNAQREVALKQLKENQRQFDATHALEMQKFGLSYAQAETDYLSTPDRYAQGADFRAAAARMLDPAGANGPRPYGADTDFVAKQPQDFAVLANRYSGQSAPSVPAGPDTSAPPPYGASPPPAAASSSSGGGAGASSQQADPRVQAITSLYKALPPSRGDGMDANDFAVLGAAKSIMSTNLRPGSLEGMRPDQRSILSSYVKRSGRSWNDYYKDYQRNAPGQQSPLLA